MWRNTEVDVEGTAADILKKMWRSLKEIKKNTEGDEEEH